MKIKITLIGTDTKTTKTVKVAETGASFGDICKAAGIDPKDKDLTVNGKPATVDTHVGKQDVIVAEARAAAPVKVAARGQGS